VPEQGDAFVITPFLETLLAGGELAYADAKIVMEAVVGGRVAPPALGAFLAALRAKGESTLEIAAFAEVMREHAVRIQAPEGALDTCGTGGDKSDTFNISTATALVAAGMGIPVAKHGNRSVSSKSGSADVLTVLGVHIEASTQVVERCIREAGIGFLFARSLHPGMKHAAPVRAAMGVRTVFNLLGPLSNPARAHLQLLGVFDPQWCRPFAEALSRLGSTSAMVVCGAGPGGTGHLDEVSTWGPTKVARLKDGEVSMEKIEPKSLGIEPPAPDALAVGSAEESARVIRDVLDGKEGPARDIVVLNAAAAAMVAGKANHWAEGVALASTSLDEGRGREVLEKLAAISNEA